MGAKKAKKKKKIKLNSFRKIIIIAIFITLVAVVINLAPNYIKEGVTGKINVIIDNNNVTKNMKFDIFVDENEIVYMATKDIASFFDEDIFYDDKYNQIITTSDTKLATLKIDEEEMHVNSSKVKIYGATTIRDNEIYLPFSEMKDVYNVEVSYIKDSNTITIDFLDEEQKKANASKNTSIKYMPTKFSKTVDKVKRGESLIVIEELENGWKKVRTSLGKIGYTKNIANLYTVREQMEIKEQTDETGDLNVNIGEKYINWSKNDENKVWPIVLNNSSKKTTTEILNDYELRENLINNIANLAITHSVNGINISLKNIKESEKEILTRFIIELKPRLKEYGKILSVDKSVVTKE